MDYVIRNHDRTIYQIEKKEWSVMLLDELYCDTLSELRKHIRNNRPYPSFHISIS